MDPLKRLSFHVLIQGVRDLQRGEALSADEGETLKAWADLAGLRWAVVAATFERAGRGEVVIAKIPEPGAEPKAQLFSRYGIRTRRPRPGRPGYLDAA